MNTILDKYDHYYYVNLKKFKLLELLITREKLWFLI